MPRQLASLCISCRSRIAAQAQRRLFATSSALSILPPESPYYIDVPRSYQPEYVVPRRLKGTLPVPREIFPARQPNKPSEEYLKNATKNKAPQNVVPEPQMSEQARRRARMAAMRKSHLREGLTELYKRKQTMTAAVAARSAAKQAERARLIAQPEREDARLTMPSTPTTMQPSTAAIDEEASRHECERIQKQKQKNLARRTVAKESERLDALHTLYMNARSFITTEAQLEEAVERVFVPGEQNDEWRTAASDGESIWNKGAPPTVKELLEEADTRRSGREDLTKGSLTSVRMSESRRRQTLDQERMKKVAEVLSGGKM